MATAEPAPLAYTVDEASRVSGLGRTTLYKLASGPNPRIAMRRVGRRTLITASSLRRLIEGEDA